MNLSSFRRQKSAIYLIAIILTVFGSESNTSTEADKTFCYGRNNTAVESGERFIPVQGDPCRICLCDKGFAVMCSSVACYPPSNCYQPRLVPDTCCEYSCSAPTPSPPPGANQTIHPDMGNTDVSINSLGLRLAASAITSFLVLTLLLFMVHRLRRRRLLLTMRRLEAHTRCPHVDDCESDIFVDNMMAFPCPPYIDPPPPYSPPKPPHCIFPNEAPPPYEPFDSNSHQSAPNPPDSAASAASFVQAPEECGVTREGQGSSSGTVNICSATEGVVSYTNGSGAESGHAERCPPARCVETPQRQAASRVEAGSGSECSPCRSVYNANVLAERRHPLSSGSSVGSPESSSPSRRQRHGGRRRSQGTEGRTSLVESSCSENSVANSADGFQVEGLSGCPPGEGKKSTCKLDSRSGQGARSGPSQDLGGGEDGDRRKGDSGGSGQHQARSSDAVVSPRGSSSWHQVANGCNEPSHSCRRSGTGDGAVCGCGSCPPAASRNLSESQANQRSLASLRLSTLLGSDNGLEELENAPRPSDLPTENALLPRSQSVNSEVSALSVCSETGETRRSRNTALRNDLPYPEYPHRFQSSPTRRRAPPPPSSWSKTNRGVTASDETAPSGSFDQGEFEGQPASRSRNGCPERTEGLAEDLDCAGTSESMDHEQKKKKTRSKASRHSTGSLPHARVKGRPGVWPCGSKQTGATPENLPSSRAPDKASTRKRESPKKVDPGVKQYGYIDNPRPSRKHSVGSQWPSGIRQLLSPGEHSQGPKKVRSTCSQGATDVQPQAHADPRQTALALGLEAVQAAQHLSSTRRRGKKRMSYPAGSNPITLERIVPADSSSVAPGFSTVPRVPPGEGEFPSTRMDLSERYPQLSTLERQAVQASFVRPSDLPQSSPPHLKVRGSYV